MFRFTLYDMPIFMHINLFKTFNYDSVDYHYVFTQIIIVKGGAFEITVNGQTNLAKQGDCIVIPKGSTATFNCFNKEKEEIVFYSLCFYGNVQMDFEDFENRPTNNPYVFLSYYKTLESYEATKTLCEELIDHYNACDLTLTLKCFYEILALIRNQKVARPAIINNEATYTRKIINYINDHYQKRITVGDIAKTLFISSGHARMVFKKRKGKTITEYLIEYRIMQAKELMHKNQLPIAEISQRCGFESQNYFTRVFKNQTGVTPSRYIASIKKDVF